jgi:hypothetical protein
MPYRKPSTQTHYIDGQTDRSKIAAVYVYAAVEKAVTASNESRRQVSDELMPMLNEVALEMKRISLDTNLPVSERLAAADLLTRITTHAIDKEAGARLGVEKKEALAVRKSHVRSIDKRAKVAHRKWADEVLERAATELKEKGRIL